MDAVVVVASRQTRAAKNALVRNRSSQVAKCNTCKVLQVKKVHVNKYYICVYCQLDNVVDDDKEDVTDDDE